jgi:hypothetical protein
MTVLWSLVGVVINQYDASTLTTGAAVLSAVPVTLVALRCAPRAGCLKRRLAMAL